MGIQDWLRFLITQLSLYWTSVFPYFPGGGSVFPPNIASDPHWLVFSLFKFSLQSVSSAASQHSYQRWLAHMSSEHAEGGEPELRSPDSSVLNLCHHLHVWCRARTRDHSSLAHIHAPSSGTAALGPSQPRTWAISSRVLRSKEHWYSHLVCIR